jgi:hypothetical protein
MCSIPLEDNEKFGQKDGINVLILNMNIKIPYPMKQVFRTNMKIGIIYNLLDLESIVRLIQKEELFLLQTWMASPSPSFIRKGVSR